MKLINDNGNLVIQEVYEPITLRTKEGFDSGKVTES